MPPQLQEPSLPIHLRVSPEIPKSNKESKLKIPRFPGRKLLPLLVFILSSLSLLRLLRISYKSSASASRPFSPPAFQPAKATVTGLTVKELNLLSDAVTRRSPCNILVFGFASQYLMLSSINNGGITVFLQDEPAEITTTGANNTRIYDVKYHEMEVKKTYKLLRYARANPACAPNVNLHQGSDCKLQLRDLPRKVYDIKWDVIVVDGPGGDALEAPGRMGTIYTAAVLARKGSNTTTDVFVHDVNRTGEKWFSWEFLCQENLVSAKGNFWQFRIKGQSNSSRFCSPETLLIKS